MSTIKFSGASVPEAFSTLFSVQRVLSILFPPLDPALPGIPKQISIQILQLLLGRMGSAVVAVVRDTSTSARWDQSGTGAVSISSVHDDALALGKSCHSKIVSQGLGVGSVPTKSVACVHGTVCRVSDHWSELIAWFAAPSAR